MKDQARDKAVEKLVAEKLKSQAAAAGRALNPLCLDAATLAAYIERTQAPAERLAAETHLASCLRCQKQVARLVRLSEANEPATAGASARAAAGARPARINWFRWAWVVPALVTVVVAGLWYTGELPPPSQKQQEVAVTSPAPPQPTAAPSAAAENKMVAPREEGKAGQARKELQQVDSLVVPSREKAVPRAPNAEGYRAGALVTKKAQPGTAPTGAFAKATSNARTAEVTAAPAAAAAPAAGAPTSQVQSDAASSSGGAIALPGERARLAGKLASSPAATSGEAADREGSTKTSNQVIATVPAPPSVSQAAAESANRELADARSTRKETTARKLAAGGAASPAFTRRAPADSVSISVQGRWRVGVRGLIQKLAPDDTWVTVGSGVTADLNEITFPTPSVGWVVGQAGTVLRSTDGGNTWQKIAFLSTEGLIHVTATGDQTATVTTRRGKGFSTTDGGRSWAPSP